MNILATAKIVARNFAKTPVTIAVSLAAVGVAMFPQLAELPQYDRARIMAGEIWRLATCHLTHWNAEHLQWDLMMFRVLGAICELRSPRRMWLCLAAGAAAVSATVFVFFPGVSEYRGLSGVDTALFTMLAVGLFCEARRDRNQLLALATGALLLGFFAKTGYEAIAGATIFVDQQAAGFMPLVWDHIAGATIGTLIAVISASFENIKSIAATGHRRAAMVVVAGSSIANAAAWKNLLWG